MWAAVAMRARRASPSTASASATAASPAIRPQVLGPGVAVQVPAAWFTTAYRGVVPTTVYPLLYLSTQPFSGVCASGSVPRMSPTPKLPPAWTTPSDGVLVLWRQDEYPAQYGPLVYLAGPDLTIDGRRARIQSWNKSARIAHWARRVRWPALWPRTRPTRARVSTRLPARRRGPASGSRACARDDRKPAHRRLIVAPKGRSSASSAGCRIRHDLVAVEAA